LGGENSKSGIVPGSLILLGGDPGIGKSTLLLQAAGKIDGVLYISGEESQQQIKLRANRLGINSLNFKILSASNVDEIITTIQNQLTTHQSFPKLVIIDSIQIVYRSEIPSSPGSVTQVRECTSLLMPYFP